MNLKLLIPILVATVFALNGCNTVQGVGKDVEAGGEKMQKKAKEVKDDM